MSVENIVEYGDCMTTMRRWRNIGVKIQMCVTSPPYWGLRDYGVEGQLGMDKTPEEYVRKMVYVFSWVKDLLTRDGTLWLNVGDTYVGGGNGGGGSFSKDGIRCAEPGSDKNKATRFGNRGRVSGLKNKDLVGIPWMLAFALRADGWYLRQDIIWSKPNPMPESVRDRCTRAHEYIFLLSKSPRYYFDADAIKVPASPNTRARMKAVIAGSTRKLSEAGSGVAANRSYESALALVADKVNKRSVWTVPPKAYSGAHFATFPPDLIVPCILAGSRTNDIVLDPFMGSGTTAQVALQLGRRYLGCELNHAYESLIAARVGTVAVSKAAD